ncbi:MAG TPA: hypothetical protein VGA61_05335 [Anaerolineae bacterium]
MTHGRRSVVLFSATLAVVLAALLCGLPGRLAPSQQAAWTPAPLTDQPSQPRVLPITPEAANGGMNGTAPAPYIPLATSAPGAGAPEAAATPDPHRVVVTESDIASVIAGGALESAGVHVENLSVRFTQGKTWITASQVTYSVISVSNLAIVGTLVAQNGVLQLQTESVTPQNLVTAMIPSAINQALKQYTSKWYVEDVQTLEGRIELRIR